QRGVDAQPPACERGLQPGLDRIQALRIERRLHGRRVEAARLVSTREAHVVKPAVARRELDAELRRARAPRARLLLRRDRRARRARDRADEVDPARVLVEADAGPRAPSPDAIAGLAEYRARGRGDLGVRIAPRAADRPVPLEYPPTAVL